MSSNILLVILDGVRAKNTSLHGHYRETTPFLESFSDRATVYEQARSPGVESLSSHTSILTGYDVPEHGITSADCELEDGHLIWERLRNDHGYRTGVFTENPFLTNGTLAPDGAYDTVVDWRAEYLFPDAVDPKAFLEDGSPDIGSYLKACFRDSNPIGSLINGLSLKLESSRPTWLPTKYRTKVSAKTYVDRFLEWQGAGDGPWAACLNLMDAHMPYSPGTAHNIWDDGSALKYQAQIDNMTWEFSCGHRPTDELELLERLYDGAIHQMDAQLQYLTDRLDDRNQLEETLLVVTSDHGEGFGEPSRVRPDTNVVGHGASGIHEVLTHVPLIVKYPGQSEGKRVTEPATLTQFPDVAIHTIENSGRSSFVPPDGVVVSHAAGDKTPKIHDKIGNYCDDLWPFTGTGRAVYEEDDGGAVLKHVSWRSESATVRVPDAQSAKVDPGNPERINSIYDTFQDVGIRRSAEDTIDSATKEHLSDLGYT